MVPVSRSEVYMPMQGLADRPDAIERTSGNVFGKGFPVGLIVPPHPSRQRSLVDDRRRVRTMLITDRAHRVNRDGEQQRVELRPAQSLFEEARSLVEG